MRNLLLQAQDQQVTVPEQTATQYYITLAIVLAFATLVIWAWYRSGYAGLPEKLQRSKSDALTEKADQTPAAIRIPYTAVGDLDEYRPQLLDAFDRKRRGVTRERTRREALRNARETISEAIDPLTEAAPPMALRAIGLGVLTTVFGAVAVSTSAVVEWLTTSSGLSETDGVALAADASNEVLHSGGSLIGQFPYGGTLATLVFSYGILGIDWLYTRWYVTGPGLILAGVALALSARRAEGSTDTRLYKRRELVIATAREMVYLWVAGVGPMALLQFAGYNRLAAPIGFTAALVVSLWRLTVLVRRVWGRIVRSSTTVTPISWRDITDPPLALALVLERVLLFGIVVTSILLTIYFVVSIGQGRLGRVLGAYLTAPVDKKLTVGLPVVILIGLGVRLLDDQLDDIRTAVADAAARKQVRLYILGRAMPMSVVAVSYLLYFPMTGSIAISLTLAVVTGLAFRGGYVLLMRARNRDWSLSPWDDQDIARVVVHCYALEVDGQTKYFAVLNGDHEIAHDDADELVTAILDDCAYMFDVGEQPEPSIESWHAHDLQSDGTTDMEETRERLREQVRREFKMELYKNDRSVSKDDLDDALADYPGEIWAEWKSWLQRRGCLAEKDETIYFVRDPWPSAD